MNWVEKICKIAYCIMTCYEQEGGTFSEEMSAANDYEEACDEFWYEVNEIKATGELVRAEKIIREQGYNELEFCAFVMAVAECADSKFSELLKMYSESGLVTIDFAYKCVKQINSEFEFSEAERIMSVDKLRRILYIANDANYVCSSNIKAEGRLLEYINGMDVLDIGMSKFTELKFFDEEMLPVCYGEEYLEAIKTAIDDSYLVEKPGIIQVMGDENSGRRFLTQHAAIDAATNLLLVDAEVLMQLEYSEYSEAVRRIRREALLYEAVVVLYDVTKENTDDIFLLKSAVDCLRNDGIVTVVTTDRTVELAERLEDYVTIIAIPPITRSNRAALWEGYSKYYGVEGIEIDFTASKYKLSASEIAKAVKYLSKIEDITEDRIDSELVKICRRIVPKPTVGTIIQNKSNFTMDDIKLPKRVKRELELIVSQVKNSYLVYEKWGLEKQFAYGRNVTALFYGNPGTGKTMAANVISGTLGIPLLRIDLSQVVDKYIGETEKKLEAIFQAAEKGNSILFFDEADSIFGKRSEVSDAKDRYANTEVSYILQRLEQYEGIVLLASNFKQNIDNAFLRRMKFVIDFPMPDAEIRKEIWMSCFENDVPCEDIDFDFLAEKFEIAGGLIKNIVLNAVFLAADRNEKVDMSHILYFVRNEQLKMGKHLTIEDYGPYKDLYNMDL